MKFSLVYVCVYMCVCVFKLEAISILSAKPLKYVDQFT